MDRVKYINAPEDHNGRSLAVIDCDFYLEFPN